MEIINQLTEQFKKTLKFFQDELGNIRASGASPAMLSKVMVDYYGEPTPIAQTATISVQGGTTIIVTPFDKSLNKEIVNGIAKANLGLNGVDEGDKIRINVPQLTTEKRDVFVKEAKALSEKAKVSVRNIRQDFLTKIKNDKTLREDEIRKNQDLIQKEVDKINKEIDSILSTKVDALMKI